MQWRPFIRIWSLCPWLISYYQWYSCISFEWSLRSAHPSLARLLTHWKSIPSHSSALSYLETCLKEVRRMNCARLLPLSNMSSFFSLSLLPPAAELSLSPSPPKNPAPPCWLDRCSCWPCWFWLGFLSSFLILVVVTSEALDEVHFALQHWFRVCVKGKIRNL